MLHHSTSESNKVGSTSTGTSLPVSFLTIFAQACSLTEMWGIQLSPSLMGTSRSFGTSIIPKLAE